MKETAERSDGELFQLMFEMGRLMKQEMHSGAAHRVGYLPLETLRYVDEQGKPDMQAVADYLRVAGPSATRLIAALVADGMLARVPDPADRRRVLLSVTPAGKRMCQAALRERQSAFARVVAPLSASDRAHLVRILSVITRSR